MGPDECVYSTVAIDILSGKGIGLFDFVLPHKMGSSSLDIILLVIFYKFFGISGFVFKLVPLFFSEVLLVIIFLFLNRYLSYKTAVVSSLFFIFAPPHFVWRSLLLQGDHFESLVFDWLIICSFFWFVYSKRNKRGRFLFFSLLCGFSVFIYYASLMVVVLCVVFLFLLDKKSFIKKYLILFVVFFLIGFSPWIVYNASNNFISLNYWTGKPMFGTVFDKGGDDFASKAYRFFSWGIPHSFHFEDAMLNFNEAVPKIFSIVYSFIILYGFLCLLYLNRRWMVYYLKGLYKERLGINQKAPEIFILFFPFLFFIVYMISSFGIDHHGLRDSRYLIPLYPFIFIIMSMFIVKLLNCKKKITKGLAYFLLFFIILICALPFINTVSIQKINLIKEVKYPASCELFSWTIQAYSNQHDFLKIAKRCDKLKTYPENYILECYTNLGRGIGRYSRNWYTDSYKCSLIKKETYRKKCYEGFASGVGMDQVKAHNPSFSSSLDQLCSLVSEDYIAECYKGFCSILSNAIGWDPVFDLVKFNQINETFKEECAIGAGEGIKFGLLHNPKRIISEANKIDKKYRSTFYKSIKEYEYGQGLIDLNL